MLKLLPYDYHSEELLHLQLKWERDPQLKHLFNYYPNEEASQKNVTQQDLLDRWQVEKSASNFKRFAIEVANKIIGEASFSMGHQCTHQNPFAAWIGLVIGEACAHGKGYGSLAMQALESQIKASGAHRIELGVFEFNHRARRLYERLGYQTQVIIPEFTWWDGRMWADHRMFKIL